MKENGGTHDPDRVPDLEQQLGALAALEEPVRRDLYFHVAGGAGEVSRNEAALAVGISPALAGFHLDRLVVEGLLETTFRRLSGRQGPGAGRPSKLYCRSSRQLDLTLPPRRYELAAQLLASAVDGGPPQAKERLSEIARERGVRLGAETRARSGSRPGQRRLQSELLQTLAGQGYEPETAPGEIRLRNCPFHALAGEHTQLVCGMNLALLEGVVAGCEARRIRPVLEPRPPLCCVNLRIEPEPGSRGS